MENIEIIESSAARTPALLDTIQNGIGDNARPLLLSGGTVITLNPMLGDWEKADVLLLGSVIVGVGPGLITAAGDDKSIVINCEGKMVLPAKVDFTKHGKRGTLTPGNPADLAVVRVQDQEPVGSPKANRPGHLDILMINGNIKIWNGELVDDTVLNNSTSAQFTNNSDHAYTGMWVDDTQFVRQNLLPNGRYDEARGDRPSAYKGQYWITGNRIDYLDDLGFWAYGEFKDNILYHAGYRFTKQ